MKFAVSTMMIAVLFAGATNAKAASAKHHTGSKTIIVESPSDLPELAQAGGAAMYLHNSNNGQAFLYIEGNGGKHLSILNVTDPAQIKGVKRVSIEASGPYDFVQALGDSAELIRYRDNSEFAVLSFKKPENPVLSTPTQLAVAGNAERIGSTGLLVSASAHVVRPEADPANYDVVDTTNPAHPAVLDTVANVKQRLSKRDTGTLFLLSNAGVTVVRQPQVEEEHAIEQLEMSHN